MFTTSAAATYADSKWAVQFSRSHPHVELQPLSMPTFCCLCEYCGQRQRAPDILTPSASLPPYLSPASFAQQSFCGVFTTNGLPEHLALTAAEYTHRACDVQALPSKKPTSGPPLPAYKKCCTSPCTCLACAGLPSLAAKYIRLACLRHGL